jgi:hypothetical protein
MQTCPTCSAPLKGRQTCRRCKTDVSVLIAVETAARQHDKLARQAFALRHFNRMHHHARRSHCLRQTQASARLLALAAMLTKQYPAALAMHELSVSRS